MSLADYNETIFGLKLDEKQDTIIYEYRKFFGNENRGVSEIAIKLGGSQALDFVKNIHWLKCRVSKIDTTDYLLKEQTQSELLLLIKINNLLKLLMAMVFINLSF